MLYDPGCLFLSHLPASIAPLAKIDLLKTLWDISIVSSSKDNFNECSPGESPSLTLTICISSEDRISVSCAFILIAVPEGESFFPL